MSRRSNQRRDAAFVLYESEISGRPVGEVLADGERGELTTALVETAESHRTELEALISENATGWDYERIAALERSIMLVALAQVAHPEKIPADTPIPPAGAIDEAVEVAKEYCGAAAPAFVNGVLDAAVAQLRQN